MVQTHIGPKTALAICCLLNLPCEVGQWFQPSQQRGVERLSPRVSASEPGTGRTSSCGKAPALCALGQLALGRCSAGPLLNFADSAAFHQDKIKAILRKSWCQQKGAQGMTSRRPGAPRLPGACCNAPSLSSPALAGKSSLCLLQGW